MRFSLSQLLLLIALVSLGIILVREWTSPILVWNSRLLPYSIPVVPIAFDDKKRTPPKYQFGPDVKFEYPDGHSMYLEMHRRGWESARENFFQNTDLSLKRYALIEPKNESIWTVEHWHAGSDLGATICADQILELIKDSNEQTVRSQLAYHRHWHIIPIAIAMFFVFGAILLIGYRNSIRIRTTGVDESDV